MTLDKYIPTPHEIGQAEMMMTDEQRDASRIREQYHEQEQPPWESFEENLDENFVRKKPSPELIRKMDASLEELGRVFAGSNLGWHLDGALNISLLNGAAENPAKYIGVHKDIDISIEKNQLEAIEAQLLMNGYGLFLSRLGEGGENKILRRVGFQDFSTSDTDHLLIAAIDENGWILEDRPLNFMDVHFIERDQTGNAIGIGGVPIPEKWTQPNPIEFHGQQINLSHPVKVLYYKLNQGRNYDRTDIDRLIETGAITAADLDELEQVLSDEYDHRTERARTIFNEIASKLKPRMTAEKIFNAIMAHPELQKRGGRNADEFQKLAERIAELPEPSGDAMLTVAFEIFNISRDNDKKQKELASIQKKIKKYFLS